MTTMLSQIEKEIYIAGWFSEMKIVRLLLCPDIQNQTENIQSRAGKDCIGNAEEGINECIRYSETGGILQHLKMGKNQHTIYIQKGDPVGRKGTYHKPHGERVMGKVEWILCPVCGSKNRNKVREDTVLKNYPLYCPKCRQETLIEAKNLQVTVITEPDTLDADDRVIIGTS